MYRVIQKTSLCILTIVAVGAGFLLGSHWRAGEEPQDRPRRSQGPWDMTAAAQAAPAGNSARHSVVVDAARRVSPAVVTIGVVERRRSRIPLRVPLIGQDLGFDFFFGSRTQKRNIPYVGSGFIIDRQSLPTKEQASIKADSEARYVLTNYHVIQGADEITVTLPDGREFGAELLDADRVVDVALLRLQADDGDSIPTLRLGDSDEIMIGETVIALGNPFGPLIRDDHPTVTAGVVSALNRSFELERDRRSGDPQRVYRNMIQTDASVNPGNSGGPLVNVDNEVIGINTFIIAPGGGSSGVNFAIPINRAAKVASEILQYGKVRSLYLDFEVIALSRIHPSRLKDLGVTETRGLLIYKIESIGPAMDAGLELGDVIVEIEGREVAQRDDLIAPVISRTVGENLSLTISRQAKRLDVIYSIPTAPQRI